MLRIRCDRRGSIRSRRVWNSCVLSSLFIYLVEHMRWSDPAMKSIGVAELLDSDFAKLRVEAQPFVLTLEDATNNVPVRRLFLESLRIPLATSCAKEIATIDVNAASESQ